MLVPLDTNPSSLYFFIGYLCDSASTKPEIDVNLMFATKANDIQAVKCLIEGKNASVDVQDSGGKTPLLWASYYGHLKIVEYLIEKGASIDIKDSEGRTAFYWASKKKHLEVAKVLAANGATLSKFRLLYIISPTAKKD